MSRTIHYPDPKAYTATLVRRRCLRKGQPSRRILLSFISNGREWQFHATKGWRSYAIRS